MSRLSCVFLGESLQVDGQVLDVTSFLSEHPGGELAILTFAGKDATEEFNMWLGEDFFWKVFYSIRYG